MHELQVWKETFGTFSHVGNIFVPADPFHGPQFRYAESYLHQADAVAIGAAFPLSAELADEQITDAFFDGLLLESDARRLVSRTLGADTTDTVSLLTALNYDTIGALVFSEDGIPSYETASFAPLEQDLTDFVSQDASGVLAEYVLRTHSSLSGLMNKIGLYCSDAGDWFVPLGLAASTHVLKFSDSALPYDIENELFCLELAQNMGLKAAFAQPVYRQKGEPAAALLTRRFDRIKLEGKTVAGLPLYGRLHQEDFCQALGFAAGLKYEHAGGNYLSRAIRLILAHSTQPALDINTFFDSLLFDYMVGNCDNHLKNYAFCYSEDWQQRSIAPVYDKMCTRFYGKFATNMGIPLSVDINYDQLSVEGVEQRVEAAGYSLRFLRTRLRALLARFDAALQETQQTMAAQQAELPPVLVECIKQSTGFVAETLDS